MSWVSAVILLSTCFFCLIHVEGQGIHFPGESSSSGGNFNPRPPQQQPSRRPPGGFGGGSQGFNQQHPHQHGRPGRPHQGGGSASFPSQGGSRPGGGSQRPGGRPSGGSQRPGNRPNGGFQQPGSRPNVGFPQPGGGSQRPGGRPSGRPSGQTPRPVNPSQNEVEGCNCLRASECPSGFGQLNHGCFAARGSDGVCCIKQDAGVRTRLGFEAGTRRLSLSQGQTQNAFNTGQGELKLLLSNQQQRVKQGKFLKKGSPARGHLKVFKITPEMRTVHKNAYALAMSSASIAKTENLSPDEAFSSIQEVRVKAPSNLCPTPRNPNCDPNGKYRSIDGTCNNLKKVLVGKSVSAFGRLLDPRYEDGIMKPRITSTEGRLLPNVRDISNIVLLDVESPHSELALNTMQMSQFIDHDLTLSPFQDMEGEAIRCCEDGRRVEPQPEECFTIDVDASDGFFGRRGIDQQCLDFVRTMFASKPGCPMGPVEQLNGITHWLDGSNIYGSDREGFLNVANPRTGFMIVSDNDLPPIDSTIDCEARIEHTPCFVGGDSRITEQPALTVMHTIWIREHNRVARELFRLNNRWSPEEVFQEARRIVIAELQHIAYNEWLPTIVGSSNINRLGIGTLRQGFRNTYNSQVDPLISNEFATAAFRYGHSMIQGIFKVISEAGRQNSFRLRDTFNAPYLLMNDPSLVDSFTRGLTTQPIQSQDSFVTQEVSNHLFETPSSKGFGLDLMSLNIQRGRDHGLPSYTQMRQFAGLPRATSFKSLEDTTPLEQINRLQSIYRHVDDIDLFAGGLVESSDGNAVLGKTFGAVVGNQFERLQKGDRFFYDNGGQAGSFTLPQLNEVRKSTMARIFCDNTKVNEMQRDAFRIASRNNPKLSCNQIPSINFQPWIGEPAGNTNV